ncbi:hypothetical protein LCGC14_1169100 [marine sediment metagenome]|uniref:CARDB domain-containing protein n=1 Tax=marine sediment metagenome TaxID=412755 RepID=A0A0F9LV99_9ZZZZ|nr:hypothetical protein [archaeon]HEC37780.1 hypothetical protein [bacterium]
MSSSSKKHIENKEFEIQISIPAVDLLDRGSAFHGFSPTEIIPTVSEFTVWADIYNSGFGPSGPFNVSIRASDDSIINKSDTEIGKVTVPSINGGNNATISYTGIFPEITNVTVNNYIDDWFYVGWMIDVDIDVGETNEVNNIGYLSYQIYVANKSDLRDRGPAYSDMNETTVESGVTAFSVFCDIENRGLKEAESSNVSFYASLDTNITTSDYYLGYDALLPLINGTYIDASWAGIFPNMPNGSYYIGWIIDVNDDVDEGHEDNNKAYILTQLIVETPAAVSSGIPGYNVVLLIGVGSVISVLIVIRRKKRR